MSDHIGVIGGSGIYEIENISLIAEHDVDTPFGKPSSSVKEMELNGAKFYFIPRHGEGHTILPSEVNYRANIFALKKLGVRYVVSISAVGSLKEEYAPGSFVMPNQFIDWTKGKRERSFFGSGMVGHVSVANPIEEKLQEILFKVCSDSGVESYKGGAYVCIEGPQFSSRAESNIYRSFGADIIGMTNVPEAFLAKEAGMAYATIAMVTDYDCWKEEHCTVPEIMKVLNKNFNSVQKTMSALIPYLDKNKFKYIPENEYAVMTKEELLSDTQKEIRSILLS
jgi:5'-methylthioadenosine phosphorylase